MTDERRWKIYVCPGYNEAVTDGQDLFCECSSDVEPADPVVVVPVSSVIPIARLREWIRRERDLALLASRQTAWSDLPEIVAALRGRAEGIDSLSALLDDVECASNPNEREKP